MSDKINTDGGLDVYLEEAFKRVLKYAGRAAFKNPKELLFVARFAFAHRRTHKIRRACEAAGEHIPLFLIASITSKCNLRCAGCYHHALRGDEAADGGLGAEEWGRIFDQARELSIPFILLAGGEPLFRADILREAAKRRGIIFPVFTNGTLFDKAMLAFFDKNRALFPVLSVEGGKPHTDARRGGGVYEKLRAARSALCARHIPFGLSVTVTKENAAHLTEQAFISEARKQGCAFIVYVEYIPADGVESAYSLNEDERTALASHIEQARAKNRGLLILSFPGDEKASGGCLAAGRGFFHINAAGGVEPCPFSPYSDTSLRDTNLRAALKSPLFTALNSEGLLQAAHSGPCHLLEMRPEVERLSKATLIN
jgi:MoaA/NifB/PqqE/SkfB family radical SAM enzyme